MNSELENPISSTEKLLQKIKEFSKMIGFKSDITESILISNNQVKTRMKDPIYNSITKYKTPINFLRNGHDL